MLGVFAPVQLPLRDAEQMRCGDDVAVTRERDVHHVSGSVLWKPAAGTFVASHTGEHALFHAREVLPELEGSRELLEAGARELAFVVLEDLDACGVHIRDELLVRRGLRDLRRGGVGGGSLVELVANGNELDDDDEECEHDGQGTPWRALHDMIPKTHFSLRRGTIAPISMEICEENQNRAPTGAHTPLKEQVM